MTTHVVPEWSEHHTTTPYHTHDEQGGLPPQAILAFLGAGIALLIFLFAGVWHLIGFDAAFLWFLACCLLGCLLFLIRKGHLHKIETDERKHLMRLSSDALANQHSIEYIPATRQLRTISPFTVPNGPITIKDVMLGQGDTLAELGSVLPVSPPFSSIISQVRPGHLFLGQGMQGGIWGDVLDLLSTLNIGRPGMGKSTLLRSVTGQLLEIGGKPMLFDPHGSILDDLGTSFECAETPKEIMALGRQLEYLLEHRLDLRRAGKRDFQPVLLMADEMPVISQQVPDALPVIRRIITEGRKVAMFSILSGVGAPAEVIGSSMVRDAMASRYIFLTTAKQANMAGIDTETAKPLLRQLEEAGPGKAILGRAGYKPELVAIPDTSVEDIRSLVVPSSFRVSSESVPSQFRVSSESVPEEKEPEQVKQGENYPELENETVQIVRDMLLQEKGPTEIAQTAFRHMQRDKALKAVRKTIAQIVKEKGT